MPKSPSQFSIRTLLWLTLVVAAFLGGVLYELSRIKQSPAVKIQIRAFNPVNPAVPTIVKDFGAIPTQP